VSPLHDIIAAETAANGPMSVARYMSLCLGHPRHGYYTTRDPLGRAGDFTTAPEISQMFGELLGLWAAQVWLGMGRPSPIRLVELGPGRGTLMADALRAAGKVGFAGAADLWLVETSPVLRAAQAVNLPEAHWAERFGDVPDGPAIIIANEFFDALPIRQFVRTEGAWRERQVGLSGGRLVWGLGPAPAGLPTGAPEGSVLETCAPAEAIAGQIGARLAASGGAALIVDYGTLPPATGGGDTLQAVAGHAVADPLEAPGTADLTAHVDFGALARALAGAGARVASLLTQGALLSALGLDARAAALARARPGRAHEIETQRRRLTAPDQMGTLFKALAATGPGQPPLPWEAVT
jgi:SAM-dependent MidA family methyltransferase